MINIEKMRHYNQVLHTLTIDELVREKIRIENIEANETTEGQLNKVNEIIKQKLFLILNNIPDDI